MLKKAHIIERMTTSRNWAHGKKSGTFTCRNKLNWSSIVYPTAVPIKTPRIHELSTSTSDS